VCKVQAVHKNGDAEQRRMYGKCLGEKVVSKTARGAVTKRATWVGIQYERRDSGTAIDKDCAMRNERWMLCNEN
jgi:hypothetical protein